MYAKVKVIDGRQLIRVRFERQIPDADAPTIEVVYEIRFPENPENLLSDKPSSRYLTRLSTIRTDTNEPIPLTQEEERATSQCAIDKAAEMEKEW